MEIKLSVSVGHLRHTEVRTCGVLLQVERSANKPDCMKEGSELHSRPCVRRDEGEMLK
jgi:hypothetical protein